jgi:hypothetical protein
MRIVRVTHAYRPAPCYNTYPRISIAPSRLFFVTTPTARILARLPLDILPFTLMSPGPKIHAIKRKIFAHDHSSQIAQGVSPDPRPYWCPLRKRSGWGFIRGEINLGGEQHQGSQVDSRVYANPHPPEWIEFRLGHMMVWDTPSKRLCHCTRAVLSKKIIFERRDFRRGKGFLCKYINVVDTQHSLWNPV